MWYQCQGQKQHTENQLSYYRGNEKICFCIAEWDFLSGLGIYADLGVEAFDDWYNGIRPTEVDHSDRKGYAGFPLDLAAKLQLGVIYHFK